MASPVSEQALRALLALGFGICLALVYDFAKALRLRAKSSALTAVLDVLYCAAAGVGLFMFTLGPGGGELRLFYLVMMALGAAFWGLAVSPTALRLFGFIVNSLLRLAAPLVIILSEIDKIIAKTKKGFANRKYWIKMKSEKSQLGRKRASLAPPGEEKADAEKRWNYSSARVGSGGAVRARKSGSFGGRTAGIGRREGRAGKEGGGARG